MAFCTAAVSDGACNLVSNTVGGKTITATYGGDANFISSNSPGVPHNVTQDLAPTAVANAANVMFAGGTVYSFTVTYNDDSAINIGWRGS